MKIAVVGLGYVGAVTAVCLARDGHQVVGVDVDRVKLDLLMQGKAPIVEEGLQEVTAAAAASGRLSVMQNVDASIAQCDLIFVCVGTPSAANGSQSLVAVERVSEQLGAALRGAGNYPVVVMRSTVPPGTTETIVKPRLEQAGGLQADRDFGLCFQPEFLREGTSVKDFYQPPFTIVGANSQRTSDVLRELFGALPGEFIATSIRTAEMMKLVCNAFHAMKVSFANEVGRLGQSLGVDARQVMELVCKDRSLNISPAYLRPGFAYGGSCLPKDLRAMLYLAKRNDVEMPMMAGIGTSNGLHIEHAATLVKSHGSRKVGMLGLSFKPGTDDLRESPLVTLAEQLIGKGYDLRIYDPAVSLAKLIGANRRYIEQTLPHIGSMLAENLADVESFAEVLVVGFRTPQIDSLLARAGDKGTPIVDLVGVPAALADAPKYQGICW
ncbi:MAG TPA: nucleotide sugar dehydrogenase [Steroidobacteraceae bacterium]|jgi:GDP-mannose 6-dehydrogenase|nr:nucleotide sugar dehydrogenase [Steroidobacteraceae bacterium]